MLLLFHKVCWSSPRAFCYYLLWAQCRLQVTDGSTTERDLKDNGHSHFLAWFYLDIVWKMWVKVRISVSRWELSGRFLLFVFPKLRRWHVYIEPERLDIHIQFATTFVVYLYSVYVAVFQNILSGTAVLYYHSFLWSCTVFAPVSDIRILLLIITIYIQKENLLNRLFKFIIYKIFLFQVLSFHWYWNVLHNK